MSGSIQPTLAGFIGFAQSQGFTTSIIPAASVWYVYAFNVAMDIVNQALNAASPTIYTLAVYNLATDNLVSWAQDVPGGPPYPNSDPPVPYFQGLRASLNIAKFTPGVVTSASDVSTSTSLLNQEVFKNMTLGDLQNLKTPWGRQYLAFAQMYGTLWGLS